MNGINGLWWVIRSIEPTDLRGITRVADFQQFLDAIHFVRFPMTQHFDGLSRCDGIGDVTKIDGGHEQLKRIENIRSFQFQCDNDDNDDLSQKCDQQLTQRHYDRNDCSVAASHNTNDSNKRVQTMRCIHRHTHSEPRVHNSKWRDDDEKKKSRYSTYKYFMPPINRRYAPAHAIRRHENRWGSKKKTTKLKQKSNWKRKKRIEIQRLLVDKRSKVCVCVRARVRGCVCVDEKRDEVDGIGR